MKKNLYIAFAVLGAMLLSSCEEFQPVFTGKYENPAPYDYSAAEELQVNTTIAALTATYTHGSPFEMTGGKVIGGRVSTTDQPGNFYKSLYIQDATGGIEIKLGKNGLYNDYLEGQYIKVSCDDLFLGEYGYKSGSNYGNGMVQIGFDGSGTDYETSYLENSLLIDSHVFRCDPSDIEIVTPVVLSESQLPTSSGTLSTCPYIGKLVTINDLTYSWVDNWNTLNEAFVLLYINSQKDKKSSSNRIFISGSDTGVATWAMSKSRMSEYLESGIWDDVSVGNSGDYNYGKVGDPCYAYKGYTKDAAGNEDWIVTDPQTGEETLYSLCPTGNPVKTYPAIERSAYSVSQYFKTAGNTCVQIRTSGYGKFADAEVDPDIINGSKKLSVTGILTLYQGKIQITVNRLGNLKPQD